MPCNSAGQINSALNQAFPPQQGNALRKAFAPILRADLRTAESDTTTTLAAVSDLTLVLESGKRYALRMVLHTTAAVAGGNKFDLAGGSCSATSITGNARFIAAAAIANVAQTALNTALGATALNLFVEYDGTILVNTGGTLVVQHAQNAASGTTTLAVGSYIEAVELPA